MLGKIEGRRRRGQQKMKWLDNITDAMDINVGQIWEIVKDREVWHMGRENKEEREKFIYLGNSRTVSKKSHTLKHK